MDDGQEKEMKPKDKIPGKDLPEKEQDVSPDVMIIEDQAREIEKLKAKLDTERKSHSNYMDSVDKERKVSKDRISKLQQEFNTIDAKCDQFQKFNDELLKEKKNALEQLNTMKSLFQNAQKDVEKAKTRADALAEAIEALGRGLMSER